MSRYKAFDRRRLVLRPLKERRHGMTLEHLLPLTAPPAGPVPAGLPEVARRIRQARRRQAPVGMAMGAHVIKQGLSRQVIDLMERGYLSAVATNGAGAIHDLELALLGATTESVADYIRTGEFGLWKETGCLNEVAREGEKKGLGLGEAVGRHITEGAFPHREVSILAAGYRLGVPVTVHVGIGYDITHAHPSCNGAALGETSYRDFLILTEVVSHLEGGVWLNVGTAVMGPEVFLKALSMARNVARQEGRAIAHFTTAVFDLLPLGPNWRREPPPDDPRYYYRPWKTLLVRTVAGGGESFYIQADHRVAMPHLRQLLVGPDEPA